MREFAVQKFADIGTVHITLDDCKLLEDYAHYWVHAANEVPLVVYRYEEGFVIPLPDKLDWQTGERDSCIEAGFSPDFVALLDKALAEGCYGLRIDRDGETYDDLPKHCW